MKKLTLPPPLWLAPTLCRSSDPSRVADHSSNGTYYAVLGYDLVTGLRSFNGANLFADLVAANGG